MILSDTHASKQAPSSLISLPLQTNVELHREAVNSTETALDTLLALATANDAYRCSTTVHFAAKAVFTVVQV